MDKNYSVRLITFGGGGKNYVKSAQRVVRDACKIGTISSARAFGESDLGEDYDKLFPSFPKRYPRGFGFWSWKPFLIAQELHNLSESDVLLYVDGGCELNSPGKPHLDSYLEFVEQNDVLVFELDTNEPPHLNWSSAMFRERRTENGEQATEAGRDCLEVTAS